MDIDTKEVLEAASTNGILNFKPGLVGGHCIGVDPYYLAYKAMIDYIPEIILAGKNKRIDPKFIYTSKLKIS